MNNTWAPVSGRSPLPLLFCFVSGHDFSRAVKAENDEGFSPCYGITTVVSADTDTTPEGSNPSASGARRPNAKKLS
jgi:hypothetical protein